MAKKNNHKTAPRKLQSTVRKASPVKATKQPVAIELPAPVQPAARNTSRRKPNGGNPAPGPGMAGAGVAFTPSASFDQIAARAYMIWEANGRPDGRDEENWREAEAQLRREATGA